MVDPWVITPADRRPDVIHHWEPMDAAREPARESQACPEVLIVLNPFGPTSASATNQVVHHDKRIPAELRQTEVPSWEPMDEAREPEKGPQAYPEATMRNNLTDPNSGDDALVEGRTFSLTTGANHQENRSRELHGDSRSSQPVPAQGRVAWGSRVRTKQPEEEPNPFTGTMRAGATEEGE